MAIEDDFTVAINGDIRHVAGTTNYLVEELHRMLGDLADDAQAVSTSSDYLDITSSTPSDRKTSEILELINSYNIDDDAAEYLFGGSVKNSDGTLYSGLKVLGAVNEATTQLVVIQNNALYSYTTDDANPFWGTQATGGYNGDSAAGVLMRCLIKTSLAGVDIDLKKTRVQARHWGDSYDFFNVTLGTGESVAAIGTTPDAQNGSVQGTVTAYTHIVNTLEGYQTIDLGNGEGAQPYYSQWTFGVDTSGDGLKGMWEFIKDASGTGSAKTLHGVLGYLFLGVTHEYTFDTNTGNAFVQNDIITWGTGATAGTGLLLAIDDQTTTGTVWIQLLTGIAPTDTLVIANELADGTHALSAAPTLRTISKTFLGSYTGSLIGAFGIGVDSGDLTNTDNLFDLTNTSRTPPNNVTYTVSGLVSGEDYLLIGPKAVGDDFEFDMMVSNAIETTNIVAGAYLMTAPIDTDAPSSGTLRVKLASGIVAKVPYSGYTGSTFTITYDFTADNSHADKFAMVSYIDKLVGATSESFTSVFDATRALWQRRRYGGAISPTKTWEAEGSLTSTGGSAVAARLSDE